MGRSRIEQWVEGYERAWRAPGTDALAALFAEDAIYSTGPFHPPYIGLAAIRRMWEDEREPDEQFALVWDVVAVEGAVGVIRLEVAYRAPRAQRYRDLWIVRLDDDGRCTRFEEWPFWPPDDQGQAGGQSSSAGGGPPRTTRTPALPIAR